MFLWKAWNGRLAICHHEALDLGKGIRRHARACRSMFARARTHVHVHACAHTCTHTLAHRRARTRTRLCTHVHARTCTHTLAHTCARTCARTHTCARTQTHAHRRTHTHARTLTTAQTQNSGREVPDYGPDPFLGPGSISDLSLVKHLKIKSPSGSVAVVTGQVYFRYLQLRSPGSCAPWQQGGAVWGAGRTLRCP